MFGVGPSIGEVVGAICSGISAICSGIGGTFMGGISTFATSLVGITMTMPEIGVLLLICQTVCKVAEILAEKPEEEKPEELAVMAEEAELKPENFDSVTDYIAYLRGQVKENKEQIEQKIEAMKMDEEKLAPYQAIGCSLYSKQLNEKLGLELSPEFWKTVVEKKNSGKMSEKVISEYVANMSEHGIKNGDALTNFVEGKTKDANERFSVYDTMKEAYRIENPNLSENELNEKIKELKSNK